MSHADRDPVMKAIKDNLLRWTCERHATDCSLDRPLLRNKALELADEHGLTGFKCSDRWLTCFLKKHGFSLDPSDSSGPIFDNYRFWIDAMRSVITRYKHKDLFHLDELTMYSDISPTGISSAMYHTTRQDASLRRTTVLMCCNAAGTEKSPLLICGTYPAVVTREDHVYTHSEDASISDGLFREWMSRLNDRMSRGERKILLLLHRDRVNAFRGLELSNVQHVFFPENFPPPLRPLKRDVFHYVKMIYRSKYVERIKEHGHRWNVENVVESLLEAWRKVPRALIIASFQRTHFRTDDCFLEIHCDAWEELETGLSFQRFVTFDDDLPTTREHRRSSGHDYNLRTTREDVTLADDKLDSRREFPTEKTHDESQANGDSRRIRGKVSIDRKKKRDSLKRSRDEAQLNEDRPSEKTNNASENSIAAPRGSKSNEEDIVASAPAKRPKIISVETVHVVGKRRTNAQSTVEELDLTTSNAGHVLQPDDATGYQESRSENDEASSAGEQRSMESSWRIDGSNTSDFTSQQVFSDTSAADSEEPNTSVVSGVSSRRENEPSSDATPAMDGKDGHSSRQSAKRRRLHSVDVQEPLNHPDNGEPEQKKSRPDPDWAKRYETTFVFGSPDVARTISTAAADEDAQQRWQRRPYETSIFTIRPWKD
ncbi:PREDICTED: uncharacterized protein LOC106745506 [Dinoponera quadriceps]|uniref:Uncharacterized protein LOC106745506 n=1 Tax=Dinoponera quadriceps TaxID=609295 RepID=A0A6P3XDY5_DINQU|nr:PREDICTED: uncharacterized protein LOC106745506 [Dinoponera quadriceps]